jgi:hypothetical protein
MKIITLFIVFTLPLCTMNYANAQIDTELSGKIDKKSVMLNLYKGDVIITGTKSDRILIESDDEEANLDLEITEKGNKILIEKKSEKEISYKISLPETVSIIYSEKFREPYKINIIGMKNRIEVESYISTVNISDARGSVYVKSAAGDINVTFSNLKKGSESVLISEGRKVTLQLPENPSVELDIKLNSGELKSEVKLGDDLNVKGIQQIFKKINGGEAKVKVVAHTCVIKK